MNDDWVIVDTETDGIMRPIHIVEIGAQLMHGWEPHGEPFRVLLNHDVPIPPEVVAIHGYTREYLRKYGEDPCEAHAKFRQYVGELPLVAHNLSFDWNRCFIAEWERLRINPVGTRGFCTLMLARRVVFETNSHRLDVLREFLGLANPQSHKALEDVKIVVELSQQVFRPRLETAGLQNFEDICRFSKKSPISECVSIIKSSQKKSGQTIPARARKQPLSIAKRSYPEKQPAPTALPVTHNTVAAVSCKTDTNLREQQPHCTRPTPSYIPPQKVAAVKSMKSSHTNISSALVLGSGCLLMVLYSATLHFVFLFLSLVIFVCWARFYLRYGKAPKAHTSFIEPYMDLAKTGCEQEMNKFIKHMRCELCKNSQVPVYKIKDDDTTVINCCCENFAKVLSDRIQKNLEISYNELATTTYIGDDITDKYTIQNNPFEPKSIKRNLNECKPIINPIFKPIDISQLGESQIEQELKKYSHTIVAGYIGVLKSGNKYAIIIGTNDDWVHVITLNRGRSPIYASYGYNIEENRWSYDSIAPGASQIREVIKNNLTEIMVIMATQEKVRQARLLNKDKVARFNEVDE